jgi:hypothetical protein
VRSFDRAGLREESNVRTPGAEVHPRGKIELVVLGALAAVLVVAAANRRDFIGDGVRHLPAVLSGHPHFGEARWIMFPPLLFVLVRPLAAAGLVDGVEGAIQPFLWVSVASGILFLVSLAAWLRVECHDRSRRAAALLLAGSCAPFLTLFSDIAEPQIAAAMAVAGLAYARVRRDDPTGAERGVVVAIVAIACAALIYQGTILAFGMLPLVASRETLLRRRVLGVLCAAIAIVPAAIVAAQAASGTPLGLALATTVGGERNPLARSFMARASAGKYVVALLAGAPQGIVGLKSFSGLPALLAGLRASDAHTVALAAANVLRLLLGCAIVGTLFAAAARRRDWRILVAAAVILILPVLRNQQYGYAKFFVLWPVPVALAALRYRARPIAIGALLVLLSNGWLLAEEVRRGRRLYASVQQTYRAAGPSTCWMTSGWAPPVLYLWPGTAAPILGTLATGNDPAIQAGELTRSLRRCFCDSASVWTDTTKQDGPMVADLARHFDYGVVDLTTILFDPAQTVVPMDTPPGIHVYLDQDRQRICHAVTAAEIR